MFKRVGDFISRQKKRLIPVNYEHPLSQADQQLISMFSQNLEAVNQMPKDASSGGIFVNLISQFGITFQHVTPEHLNGSEIGDIIEKYVKLCTEIGKYALVDNNKPIENICVSLSTASKLLGGLPSTYSFFELFSEILRKSEGKMEELESGYDFFVSIFKNAAFFNEFCSHDGFICVFKRYFMDPKAERVQKIFMDVLFKTTPVEFYKKKDYILPSLKNMIDAVNSRIERNSEDDRFGNACRFLTSYVVSMMKPEPGIIKTFRDNGGFNLLNQLFVNNCPESARDCYELLMIESGINSMVLENFFALYQDPNISVDVRSGLVGILQIRMKNMEQTYQRLTSIAPLASWIFLPPKLTKEALDAIGKIIKSFTDANLVNFEPILNDIFEMVVPPEKEDIPVDTFLGILVSGANSGAITPEMMIQERIFDRFLFTPSAEEVAEYYAKHKQTLQLVTSAYISDSAEQFRFLVLQKFIIASQFRNDIQELIEFLSNLFDQQFSMNIVELLLSFTSKPHILTLLTREVKKRPEAFKYFVEADGFVHITELLTVNPQLAQSVMKLVSALSQFSPHSEIDDWINSQPITSPIFNCRSDFLAQVTVGFSTNNYLVHVPSLLPFASDFDATSPLNLYLVGKYGVPACLNRNRSLLDIPHISAIANRYVDPETARELFMLNPSKIYEFIDLSHPQFSLYEFVPLIRPAYLRFKKTTASISFWFRVPAKSKTPVQILRAGFLSVTVVDESLVFSTGPEQIALLAQCDSWHHAIIHFNTGRIYVESAEILLDLVRFDPVKTAPEVKVPTEVIFGDRSKPLPVALYLAKSIIISETNLTEAQVTQINRNGPVDLTKECQCTERSERVYHVHYLGFASYFRTSIQIENLFRLLETVRSQEQFRSVFMALLNLQKLHRLKHAKFWNRMLLAFKRSIHVIDSKFTFYTVEYPSKCFDSKRVGKIVSLILSDIELWYLVTPESIKSMVEKAEEMKVKWYTFCDLATILTIMRSGLKPELIKLAVDLAGSILTCNQAPDKMKMFFNAAITLCDWSIDKQEDLMKNYVPPSELQDVMLRKFVEVLYMAPLESELYSPTQLLDFMLLFMDERAFHIMEILTVYSHKNPKYIQPSLLMSYVFEKLEDNRKTWEYAFSILSGTYRMKCLPQRFRIERPAFLGVIIEMVSHLTMKIAHAKYEGTDCTKMMDLLLEVMDSLLSLDNDEYIHFAVPSYQNLFNNLANLGISPNSYETDISGERKMKIWSTFTVNNPGKDELKAICSMTTHHKVCSPVIPDLPVYQPDAIKSTSFLYFPEETDQITWMIDVLKSSRLIDLFAKIVFASGNLKNTLLGYIRGHASMFKDYSRYFGQEIALAVLKLIPNPAFSNHYKSIIFVMHQCVLSSLFSDCYMRFMRLVLDLFRFLNASASFEQFVSDEKMLKAYRDIILAAFAFIPEGSSLELYQLLTEYRQVVFHKPIFSDPKFATYWIHLTRQRGGEAPERIRCMELAMKLIDSSLVTSYSASSAQADWIQFKTQTLQHIDQTEMESRMTKYKQIIEGKQRKFSVAARHELMSRIFRVCNYNQERAIVIFNVSSQLRSLERCLYEFSILSRKYEYQTAMPNKAVHLSPISLPLYQSRALSPSPFALKVPPFKEQTKKDFFALPFTPKESKVPIVASKGYLQCSPEWCYFHTESILPFTSPFEVAHVFDMEPNVMMRLFMNTFEELGTFHHKYDVSLFYFIHTVPSVLFVSDSHMALLVLAKTNESHDELELIVQPKCPVGFLPFTEAVTLGEFAQTSLFCGHVVVIVKLDKIIKLKRHLYIHKNIGLSIYPFGASNFILIFDTTKEMQEAEKILSGKTQYFMKLLPSSRFYFVIDDIQKATDLWTNNIISNFDYLMLLNSYGGRSFADLSQYPVLPWVTSPNLEPRDLSLPMGQLAKARAAHYDQTFELSSPPYFYGFHYSLPGIVFWLLVRLPPFTFFQWDLNEGWDDSQRLFVSILDAYESAACMNPSDLKELIPQMYTLPEAFSNPCNMDIDIRGNVILPEWTRENTSFFVETSMKMLNCASDIHQWIDLIFGYKEVGEKAIEFKNMFLPSSYHDCTAEAMEVDDDVFTSQVLNFGQCPNQLMTEPHPPRLCKRLKSIDDIAPGLNPASVEVYNPNGLISFKCVPYKNNSLLAIPTDAAVVSVKTGGSGFYFTACREEEYIALVDMSTMKMVHQKFSIDFAFISHLSVSADRLLLAVSFDFGRVDIHQIVYDKGSPVEIYRISSFSGKRKCSMSTLLTTDFICASFFEREIIMWNIATQLRHREIEIDFKPVSIYFDQFNAVLTVVGPDKILQFSVNGEKLHEVKTHSTNTSSAFLPLDFSFDRRLPMIGHEDGSISIAYVDPVDYNLKILATKPFHKLPITSMFLDEISMDLVTCDARGLAFYTKIHTMDASSETVTCHLCDNPMTSACAKCNEPMCDACYDPAVGMCPKCAKEGDFFQFPSFT